MSEARNSWARLRVPGTSFMLDPGASSWDGISRACALERHTLTVIRESSNQAEVECNCSCGDHWYVYLGTKIHDGSIMDGLRGGYAYGSYDSTTATTTTGGKVFYPRSVETIDGYVGQVQYESKIVWQGEAQQDVLNDEGKVVKSAATLATEDAQNKINAVVKGLFA